MNRIARLASTVLVSGGLGLAGLATGTAHADNPFWGPSYSGENCPPGVGCAPTGARATHRYRAVNSAPSAGTGTSATTGTGTPREPSTSPPTPSTRGTAPRMRPGLLHRRRKAHRRLRHRCRRTALHSTSRSSRRHVAAACNQAYILRRTCAHCEKAGRISHWPHARCPLGAPVYAGSDACRPPQLLRVRVQPVRGADVTALPRCHQSAPGDAGRS